MGKREINFSRELYIDREDFTEVAPNGKYKRLAIDKEVRLRNAYVINATRCEKDSEGNITTVYCTYDPETLGKTRVMGAKLKASSTLLRLLPQLMRNLCFTIDCF